MWSDGFPETGESVADVAAGLRRGSISPSELPIRYIVRDGQRIAINNRFLLALRRGGLDPTATVNVSGNPIFETRLSQRLAEMGGFPSETIRVRGAGSNASFLDWLTP